ncbi:MAG TPA: ribbon-helix-helix domain-containing protein [Geobacterales bacterium]|nr:ribbon-helix-helix domain-containing protein [Geobacterales bacterium]
MKIISIKLPEAYLERIDKLIQQGRFTSRSELIRFALLDLFRKEEETKKLDERLKIMLGP